MAKALEEINAELLSSIRASKDRLRKMSEEIDVKNSQIIELSNLIEKAIHDGQ